MEKLSLKPKFFPSLAIVAVCVFAYFSYSTYWLVKTIPWIIDISLNPKMFLPPTGLLVVNANSLYSAYVMEYSGFLGLILRFAGATYALAATFLIIKDGESSVLKHQSKIYAALLLNGLYFFSFVPVVFYLLNFSALPVISNRLLSTTLLAQLALISPFLLYLGYKIRKPVSSSNSGSLWRIIVLASLAHVLAIWITYMSKWSEMMAVDPYLFSALSVRIMGFLNTIVVQSLSCYFRGSGDNRHFEKGFTKQDFSAMGTIDCFSRFTYNHLHDILLQRGYSSFHRFWGALANSTDSVWIQLNVLGTSKTKVNRGFLTDKIQNYWIANKTTFDWFS